MEGRSFTGPLFIVGRPRSGTKLLRSVLNEHPRVAIPISETNFIPDMVDRFGEPCPLWDPAKFDEFFRRFSSSTFFSFRAGQGVVMTPDELRQHADLGSWASVFESILKFYAPKAIGEDTIWGDKSPSYLVHMPRLKSLFPEARFLHIVRDPRDNSLSAREAWGKHVLRSAECWRREVGQARQDSYSFAADYHELRFEDLVSRPDQVVAAVCGFLGVDFQTAMMRLTQSHEDRGRATGALTIVATAHGRYRSEMKPRTVRRIEEIVTPLAIGLGYELESASRFKPVPEWLMNLYRVRDGFSLSWFYLRDRGFLSSLRHLLHRVGRSV